MTSTGGPSHEGQGETVGSILARLRRTRGFSGAKLASMANLSKGKIARIERGQGPTDLRDVRALACALGADEGLIDDLVKRVRLAKSRIIDKDTVAESLHNREKTVADWESEADVVRELAITALPGLLQTSTYAKASFSAFERFVGMEHDQAAERTILAAVAARIKRQEFLAKPGKRLHAIITESSLRGDLCSPTAMLAQLEHLREMASLPNVTIAFVSDNTTMQIPFLNSFSLLDDQLLPIDAYNAGLMSRGEKVVAFYRCIFDSISARATTDIDRILGHHQLRILKDIRQMSG